MDQSPTSAVWWRGAMKGAAQGVPLGIGIGLAAAALLSFAVIPLFPALAPVFGAFLTTPGINAAFLPVPLLLFNTALTVAANFIAGGNLAVTQHRQQVDHARNEARISAIEAREQALEQHVTTPSRHVQQLVARGPRNGQSFADAANHSTIESAPTLH